jgi:tyrosinase
VNEKRRELTKGCLSALVLTSLPGRYAYGQTTGRRLEWQAFKATADYPYLISALRTMQANTNAGDPKSWAFWTRAHVNYCPHNIAYFLAWHRGYLYQFEQQLRLISGRSSLTFPYWDYYQYPNIPSEFTNASGTNPLYVAGRVNTNVFNALTMAPFSSRLTNFQRGAANAFEPSIEGAPHNPVHDIIGGYMTTMESPMDPIFFLHHANIDRLWVAWVAAGGGRQMPSSTSNYWNGRFTYSNSMQLNRNRTINTTGLGYVYANQSFPSGLPSQARTGKLVFAQFRPGGSLNRPPLGQFVRTAARAIGANRRSVGGLAGIRLNENSVSGDIPLQAEDLASLQAILAALRMSPMTPAPGSRPTPYRSVQVILDDVRVTSAGKNGGYFYNVYLNMPASGDVESLNENYLVGNIGPFAIAGAVHHGNTAQLVFPATQVLAGLSDAQISTLVVSLVRVSGANSPSGDAITIGEARIEISADDVE